MIGSVLLASPLAAVVMSLAAGTGLVGFAAAAVAAPLGAVLIVYGIGDDIRDVTGYVRRLVASPDTGVARIPTFDVAPLGELAVAVAQLERSHRRAHRGCREQTRATQSVLEALPDPVLLVAEDRLISYANDPARALLGAQLEGRDLAAALRHPAVLEAVDGVLRGGASRQFEFNQPVPVERTYEVRVKPFQRNSASDSAVGPGGSGTAVGRAPVADDGAAGVVAARVLITLHDITAVKRSDQMRADFVANASHELRSPLSSLLGFIETLRGPARDDPSAHAKFLAIMHDNAVRMSRLISDLLSLSRIELDEHRPPTGRVDVLACLDSCIHALELRAAERKLGVRIEAPETLPRVVGDADQLVQVFHNLLSNAIKYAEPATEVVIRLQLCDPGEVGSGLTAAQQLPTVPANRTARSPGLVTVSVIDRGEGIPPTHLPRLTERFYRVDAARSRSLGGTGLGLAIVKHIVNRHRGRLTIESELGVGSTFTVYLPAVEPAPETRTIALPRPAFGHPGGDDRPTEPGDPVPPRRAATGPVAPL